MASKPKMGRPCKPPRIRINAIVLADGKKKHLISVTTSATSTEVMKALQSLEKRG